jgi:hypothetical protein
MTWTVRIYNDETMGSYTDHTAEDELGAYGVVYQNPTNPLNEKLTWVEGIAAPDAEAVFFEIYNPAGLCTFSLPSDEGVTGHKTLA